MYVPSFTRQFKQDRKRSIKRGLDVAHLDDIITRLVRGDTLDAQYRVHPLRGDYAGHMECHVGPDFLLIWYYAEGGEITFVRAGTHADLFDR